MLSEKEVMEWVCRRKGINSPCQKCKGFGTYAYGHSSTFRGGMGMGSRSNDVCDECWGSGSAHHKGANIKELERKHDDWKDEQCAKWFAEKAGIQFKFMKPLWGHFLEQLDKEAKRRKFPKAIDEFWYKNMIGQLRATIHRFIGEEEKEE
jgi:hypothetical protein